MRVALLGLFVVSVLGACESGSARPREKPVSSKPRDARTADADPGKLEGKALYDTFCSQCHGVDMKGYKADNAPSLINPSFLASATDEYIHRSIAAGRPGTSMAGYAREIGGPLDKAAIDRIVGYLRSHGGPATGLGTAASTGDAKRGAAIYARECQKCHGTQQVRGNTVHLANAQFLAVASDAFIRYAIVTGRPGTPMESFANKLDAQSIDDVVAYVRSLGVIKAEGTLPPPTGKEPLVLNPKGKAPDWKKLRADPNGPPRYVSVDELKRALDEKRKVIVIDARPPSDWMRVHVQGAVSIPYHDMHRLQEVPDDVWVVAYCACPHHLSGIVVDELIKRGHKKALVLDEGILEWHRRGYPVTAAEGVVAPPKESMHP